MPMKLKPTQMIMIVHMISIPIAHIPNNIKKVSFSLIDILISITDVCIRIAKKNSIKMSPSMIATVNKIMKIIILSLINLKV